MHVPPLLAHTADIFFWLGTPVWALPFAAVILAILLGRRVGTKVVLVPFVLHTIMIIALGMLMTGNFHSNSHWLADVVLYLFLVAASTSPALAFWIMMTTKKIDSGSGNDNK